MMQPNLSFPNNNMNIYFRSGLLLLLMVLATLVITTLVLTAYLLPFRFRYFLANQWIKFVLWATEKVCGLSYEVEGLANIPTNNAIVLCNHQSAWETIALQNIFPVQSFLLKRELLWLPVWGWAMAALDPISINRNTPTTALRSLLSQGIDRLEQGLWVVIFPEGTRVEPGKKKKFNAGGSLLAERSGYPIIPVAHNAGNYWPKNSFLKKPGKITVKIGKPISSKNKKAETINQEAEKWINQTMEQMSE